MAKEACKNVLILQAHAFNISTNCILPILSLWSIFSATASKKTIGTSAPTDVQFLVKYVLKCVYE
jgi:Na+(H+)/acetate symporter ActP